MKFYVITPCGREGDKLSTHHNKVVEEIYKINHQFEINYIVDSFTDEKTLQILSNLDKANVIHNTEFAGLAGCYKKGYLDFLNSDADYALEMDIESHPANKIADFVKEAENGYEIILGSRNIKNSQNKSNLKRRLLSFAGSFLSRVFLNSPLSDSTSGFQMFSRRVVKSIDLFNFVSTSYFFQTEMKVSAVNQFVEEVSLLTARFPFYKKKIIKFYDFIIGIEKNRKFRFKEIPFVYCAGNSSINYKKIFDSFVEFIVYYLLN